MTTSTAAHSAFAKRYARAYIDSIAKKDYKAARAEIDDTLEMINSSEGLKEILENPILSKADKINFLDAFAKKTKMSPTLATFIKVLIENSRLKNLNIILQAAILLLDEAEGVIEAKVETAYPLSKAQAAEIEKEIGSMTGGKARITVEVKPDLIGGMVVTIGSKRIDSSIKRRLELLEQDLRSGANENIKMRKTG